MAMEQAPNHPAQHRQYLLAKIRTFYRELIRTAQSGSKTNTSTISALQELKPLTEEINQSHHEYLCTKALANLRRKYRLNNWRWNPRNSGSGSSADIEGIDFKGIIVVAAECTASIAPKGALAGRMKRTLDKLNRIGAREKWYFVVNQQMGKAATAYISAKNYRISVKCYET